VTIGLTDLVPVAATEPIPDDIMQFEALVVCQVSEVDSPLSMVTGAAFISTAKTTGEAGQDVPLIVSTPPPQYPSSGL